MLKKFPIVLLISVTTFAQRKVALGDWPDQRGPNRGGVSQEKNLPEKWSLDGENLLWRVPFGGRSAPVIIGNHLYVQNPAGRGADEQERVMCLDPETGKVIWEFKFNIFQSDAPVQRTVSMPFEWKQDAWYRLKLRVENQPDGKIRVRGKAWAVGQPEPAEWVIEKIDPIGNKEGAPGIFAAAPFGLYLDNLKLTAN